MKVLTVYANPNPRSFCHAILEQFSKGLKDAGHTNEVVDLYAIGFDPVLKLQDYTNWINETTPMVEHPVIIRWWVGQGNTPLTKSAWSHTNSLKTRRLLSMGARSVGWQASKASLFIYFQYFICICFH